MTSLTDLAGNLSVSTEQVLTALRIVATRANVPDLAEWAAKELEGYDKEDTLPAHRIWHLAIVASIHNPMQGIMKNAHLGDDAIAEEHREAVTNYYCRAGIGQLEDILSTREGSEPMAVEHPNLAQLVNRGRMLGPGWTCVHATAEFSPVRIKTVIDKARQTALRLCLECEKQGMVLQYEADANTATEENKAWMDTLKKDGTRLIIQAVWDLLRWSS